MGINGLLPIIKPVLTRRHISYYSYKRIGIDGHAWLYQIAPSIAQEIFFGLPTNKHIYILYNRIKSLRENNIQILFVFDGDNLKSKNKTLLERTKRKNEAKAEVLKLIESNDMLRAKEMMKRCISIDKNIMSSVLTFLEKEGIDFIISPYESDAQLAYLQRINYIEYIITEDSDLIVYGSTKILYKYDNCYVYEYKKEKLSDIWGDFFAQKLLDICILSGCDYLNGLPGVGIKTAHKLLSKHQSIEKVLESLKSKIEIPVDFSKSFERAKLTFLHQIVFDPIYNKRVFLSGLDLSINRELDFLGSFIDEEYQFSRGFHLAEREKYAKSNTEDFTPKPFSNNKVLGNLSTPNLVIDENTVSPYFKK